MTVTLRRFVYAAMLAVTIAMSSWLLTWDSAPDGHDVIWLSAYTSEAH